MTDRNDILNKSFDALLSAAAEEATYEAGKELLEKDVQKHEFSKEHEAKMKRIFRKERRKIRLKKINSYSKRVAGILFVVFIVSFASVMSVSAWRNKLMNYFFDPSKVGTALHFNEDGSTTFQNEGILMYYIPYGFHSSKDSVTDFSATAYFKSDNQYFCLSVTDMGTTHTIDTENSTQEELRIRGCDAVLFSKPDSNLIVWNTEEEVFTLHGNISKEELIKIAENSVSLRKE